MALDCIVLQSKAAHRVHCGVASVQSLQSCSDVSGMAKNVVELRVAMCKKGFLMLLTGLLHSVANILEVLIAFDTSSGFGLGKGEVFTVGREAREYPLKKLPFRMSSLGFV